MLKVTKNQILIQHGEQSLRSLEVDLSSVELPERPQALGQRAWVQPVRAGKEGDSGKHTIVSDLHKKVR